MTIQNPKSNIQHPQVADLLLEIGTEEIPAAYLDAAIAQLRDDVVRLLNDAHSAFKSAESFGTPRRLTLIIRALSLVQDNPPEEIRGPSKQACYDASGKPTGALLGFLKGRGGKLSQTKLVPTDKGDYVYLLKPARMVPTASVLPPLLIQLVSRLKFPKTMRWDASGFRFARPLRWLVCLYGNKPLAVSLGSLKSGKTTWVGGPKRPKAVHVSSVTSYLAGLKKAGIILDQRQRKARIEQLIRAAAKQVRGTIAPEAFSYGLLDEVANLVEQPVVMTGAFDRKYLDLPREVLLASMAKHQRVFAVQAGQALLPKFVAILDGKPRTIERIRQTFEHILNARLADSLLFWVDDCKRSIKEMANELAGVTFHERLGTMQDKANRLVQTSRALAQAWGLSAEESKQLERACLLAKADLVSRMVREFPTLQGVMGKHYARCADEVDAVALAIEEQYLPIGGKLPASLIGSALAILEKLDTLVLYFNIGIEPTGDEDPFGLRRAAQGIVEVAWKAQRPMPLAALLAACAASAGVQLPDKTKARIAHYLFERLYTFAWPKPAPSRDLIDAVLGARPDDLVDAMHRMHSLQRLDGGQTLLKAAKVVERTTNILKNAKVTQAEVDPARFQEPLEHELWRQYGFSKERISKLIDGKSYVEATSVYGDAFFDSLQEFFGKVIVNADDPAVRQNRLALMKAINLLYTERIADLSKLAILQSRSPASPQSAVTR